MRRTFALILASLLFAPVVLATDFTSSNFMIQDPVLDLGAGFSTSSSFGLNSSIGGLSPGISTITNFKIRSGFEHYGSIPGRPVDLNATPLSASQISLAWSDTSFEEAGFYIERRTGGGGYSQIADVAANTLSYSDSGLTASTVYFYRIRAYNPVGASDYSNEAGTTTQNADSGQTGGGGNSGGGGGGGGSPNSFALPFDASVVFSGRAYPLNKVILLKDGQKAVSTIAGPDAAFTLSLSGLSSGDYTFSIYGEDVNGRRSAPFTFPILVTSGAAARVSNMFIAPTIAVDKQEVRRGEDIAIFGQTVPNGDVTIAVNSEQEFFEKVKSDKNGVYLYNFDTSVLEDGRHLAKSKSAAGSYVSSFSDIATFLVGGRTIKAEPGRERQGDLNGDKRIDIGDFSVAAYWFGRPSPPLAVDINGDGKVDLVDFSVMAYNWTG